jgi:hypothetical protein
MTEQQTTHVLYPPYGGNTGDLLSVGNDFMGISQRQAVSNLLYKQGECRVWFADVVQRVGRRGELKPKALVVTSKSLYFLEPGSYTIRAKLSPISSPTTWPLKLESYDSITCSAN